MTSNRWPSTIRIDLRIVSFAGEHTFDTEHMIVRYRTVFTLFTLVA